MRSGAPPDAPLSASPWGARLAAFGAATGWLGLAMQAAVSHALVTAQGRGLADTVLLLLGYFTILTNLLAAIALTACATRASGRFGALLRHPVVLGGVAANMAVVGLVYSVLLRHIWQPTGWAWVADELLHDVTPLLFLGYWWLAVPKRALAGRQALFWSLYPLGYLAYALVRGAWSGAYAYPFIDVAALGYGRVLLNSAGLWLGFVLLAWMLVALGRWQARALPPAAGAIRSS